MSNQSVILCTYMHLFNNVMSAHATTAVLRTLSAFLFLSGFANSVCN